MRLPNRHLSDERFETLCETLSPGAREVADAIVRLGRFPATQLALHPDWAEFIHLHKGSEFDASDLRALVQESDSDNDLRRLRMMLTLRLLYQETSGGISIRSTTREFSELAGAFVEDAMVRASETLVLEELNFCVLGLGKIGGFELNYGSDIDLIYLARDVSENTVKFANEVSKQLTRKTDAGFLFRVDLRLRPEGATGVVVQSATAMTKYYLDWGRTWERAAMLKARPIAGDLELGQEFLTSIEPFLYRRHLDFDSIDALRVMKAAIEENAEQSQVFGSTLGTDQSQSTSPIQKRLRSRLGGSSSRRQTAKKTGSKKPVADHQPGGWDVKVGRGGIREIEFFVVALQLVHCGRSVQLRTTSTVEGVNRLLAAGLISNREHTDLTDAYDLYRRVEHCIQMEDNQQTHLVPQSGEAFEQIALRLQLDSDTLREALATHRENVIELFARLFSDEDKASEKPTVDVANDVRVLLHPDGLRPETRSQTLQKFGFKQTRHTTAQLQALTSRRFGPFKKRGEFAHYLLQSVVDSPNPDVALSQLSRFIDAVGDRPGYFAMLRENPHATRLLVHILGGTRQFASSLIQDPNVFSRLLSVSHVAVVRSGEELTRDLDGRLESVEHQEHRFGIVRRFQQEETLRIGLHLTGESVSARSAFTQLSDVADVVVRQTLSEVFEPLRGAKKSVVLPEITDLRFCVLALGKYGGRELGFGSDLDLMFVYEDDRQYRLDHSFFAKLAQRLIRAISAGDGGKMYAVDTRLRPSGRKGALVVSLPALRSYHANEARLWERQALIRARVVVGNETLRSQVEKFRRETVFGPSLPDGSSQRFSEMLQKIYSEKNVSKRNAKYTPGAIVSSEFAVQYLQLVFGVDETNTGKAIEKLGESQIDVEKWRADYEWLRRIEALIRMSELGEMSKFPSDPDALKALARRCGYVGEGAVLQLEAEFDRVCERGLKIVTKAFSRSKELG